VHSTDGKAERPGRVTQAQEGRTDRSERTKDSPAGANGKRISVEYAEVTSLRPSDDNPRVMPEEEMQALERSIERFGLVDPFVVRRQDSTVIGGNQRLVAAQRVGLRQVPVVFLDVSQDEARLLNLALNRVQGRWDEDRLAALFHELDSLPDLDVSLSGFREDEIDKLIARVEALDILDRDEQFDLEEALEQAEKQCRVQRGDLWLLGRHRLVCGDATTSDVQRLLAGEAAHTVFTDPPYNVGYDPARAPSGRRAKPDRRRQKSRNGNGRRRPLGTIQGNNQTAEAYQEFLVGAFRNLAEALPSGGAVYVCGGVSTFPPYVHAFEAAGLHLSSVIVWDKGSLALTRKDYHSHYELIFYGWPEGKGHKWFGDRTQTDVWVVHRENARTYLHPTQKPVELVQRAIQNSSRLGQPVLDIFLGSGTTVIACEKSGRRCLGLEIDPLFCQVALARWEAYTGERARRDE
jgi:DNA modification methylase